MGVRSLVCCALEGPLVLTLLLSHCCIVVLQSNEDRVVQLTARLSSLQDEADRALLRCAELEKLLTTETSQVEQARYAS
jgi:hypothetical protein